MESRRRYFHRDRYNEIKDEQLAPLAAKLGEAFTRQPSLSEHQLEQILQNASLPPDITPQETEKKLHSLGYIWQGGPDNDTDWVPGIPSLMKYVQERASYRQVS